MTNILTAAIDPALKRLLPHGIPITHSARAMLYAIGLQESGMVHRYQLLPSGAKGPARGLWQFESGLPFRLGGVALLLDHEKVGLRIMEELAARTPEYPGDASAFGIWKALATDDILAAMLARLLLWTDPHKLSEANESSAEGAWKTYLRCWRPGKPRPEEWPANWSKALDAVRGGL